MKQNVSTIDSTDKNKNEISVDFYPSVDDQVYVALKIGATAKNGTFITFCYQLFLILNCIAFPAFLLYSDLALWGGLVFLINVFVVIFTLPRSNANAFRKYYESLYADRENNVATVTLSAAGINYQSDGAQTFWPWKRIRNVEETADAIYFFFDGNGFGVRKNGFAYIEDQNDFVQFARTNQGGHQLRDFAE